MVLDRLDVTDRVSKLEGEVVVILQRMSAQRSEGGAGAVVDFMRKLPGCLPGSREACIP